MTARQTAPRPIELCGGLPPEGIGAELVDVLAAHRPELVRETHGGGLQWYGCTCSVDPGPDRSSRRLWSAKDFDSHVRTAVVAALFRVPPADCLAYLLNTTTPTREAGWK
ncbi:hypothetical protein ACI2LF_43655 [Kribbella sp. NPDC020789]